MKFILSKKLPIDVLDKITIINEDVEYYNYIRNKLDSKITTRTKLIDISYEDLKELSKYFSFNIYKIKNSQYPVIEIDFNSNYSAD